MRFEIIELKRVRPNSWNPNEMRKEEFEALKKRIEEDGFITAITVREIGDGWYEIVDGEHRWKAAKELGLDRIPAIILKKDEISEEKAMLNTVSLNLLRGEIDPIKLAELVKDLDVEKVKEYLVLKDEELDRFMEQEQVEGRYEDMPAEVLENVGIIDEEDVERKAEEVAVEKTIKEFMEKGEEKKKVFGFWVKKDRKEWVEKILRENGNGDMKVGLVRIFRYVDKMGDIYGIEDN